MSAVHDHDAYASRVGIGRCGLLACKTLLSLHEYSFGCSRTRVRGAGTGRRLLWGRRRKGELLFCTYKDAWEMGRKTRRWRGGQ